MTADQLKERTKNFGIRTVKVVDKFPAKRMSQQSIGLATGADVALRSEEPHTVPPAEHGAMPNLRKARNLRGRSRRRYLLVELIIELGYVSARQLEDLIREANEILAIIVASIKTSRRKQ